MNLMSTKNFYNYHTDTVAMSDHAWERHAERLQGLSAEDMELVKARSIEAAELSKNHTGVLVKRASFGDIWAVVAGRTVKTIIVTISGVHLSQTSPCNKYHIRSDA